MKKKLSSCKSGTNIRPTCNPNKKDKEIGCLLVLNENEKIFQNTNDDSNVQNKCKSSNQVKSKSKQRQTQNALNEQDKSNAPSEMLFVSSFAPGTCKINQSPIRNFDKVFYAQNNEKIGFVRERNKNTLNNISNEFRQGNNPFNKPRPSLTSPQSIELFQKEHLCHDPLMPNRSKFALMKNDLNSSKDKMSDNEKDNHSDREVDDLAPKKKLPRKSVGLSMAGENEKDVPKENQDSFVVMNNILGLDEYSIYGVMDGHGANGHFASQYIKQAAEDHFNKEELYFHSKKNKPNINETTIYNKLIAHDYAIIKGFFKKMADELINAKFDVHYSGSTCVIIFQVGNKVICANTGDSRAIIIKDNRYKVENPISNPFAYFEAIPLSVDHKPDDPEEKTRIEKMGGEVEQNTEKDGTKGGPYRVWVKGENYPGIAMSRSLGDEIAESIGVVHTPDIICKEIDDTYKFLALGSDGVWEFLSNENVMSLINIHYFKNDVTSACQAVINEARACWKKEDPGIDDITIVIAFLSHIHVKKSTV